jgi:glycosyltransferase involved in cell wall biosynthesis
MLRIIHEVEFGISVSLWEGFNLPIAELQYLGKPVLAFDLAAHPEVVVSRDQLCTDTDDMANKLYRLLRTGTRHDLAHREALTPWRRKFTWQRFMSEFQPVVEC